MVAQEESGESDAGYCHYGFGNKRERRINRRLRKEQKRIMKERDKYHKEEQKRIAFFEAEKARREIKYLKNQKKSKDKSKKWEEQRLKDEGVSRDAIDERLFGRKEIEKAVKKESPKPEEVVKKEPEPEPEKKKVVKELTGTYSLVVLIKMLRDEDEDIRRLVAKKLKSITGKDFGEDADAWQKWWDRK